MKPKFKHKILSVRCSAATVTCFLLSFGFLVGCMNRSLEPQEEQIIQTGTAVYNHLNNKTWRHRVNSVNEIKKFESFFTGFEFDVFYDSLSQKIIVKHDEQDTSSLTIEAYFNTFNNLDEKFFWIDIKNLEWNNIQHFYNSHLKTDSIYQIGDRLIYESYNAQPIKRLNELGMSTSYWVPRFEYSLSDTALTSQEAQKTEAILSECKHNALSAHYSMLPFLDKYFGHCNIHLWTNGLYSEEDKKAVKNILSHSSVKVVLIDYDKPILIQNR